MSTHILRHPDAEPTKVKCPRCGDLVVFNGNFFCNGNTVVDTQSDANTQTVVTTKGTCKWSLRYPLTTDEDRRVAELLRTSGYEDEFDQP